MTPPAVLAGIAAGFVAPFLLNQIASVAWTWNVAIGSTVTFLAAVVLSTVAEGLIRPLRRSRDHFGS